MKKLKLLLLGVGFAAFIAMPAAASADVNNFLVTSFAAQETLTRADPQGELQVIERINVDFTDNNHGILRAIPNSYKHHSLQLSVQSVTSDTHAPTSYTTYGSNGNTVLKIGDPSQTVTGPQEYTIEYTLRNVISFYKDHDELYWNVNGDQWQQSFRQVAVTVVLPKGLNQTKQPVCYTGAYNSTARDCTISTSDGIINSATTGQLSANQTLTYVAGFQKGYFQPSKWYQTLGEYAKPLLEFLAPVLIIGGGSFLYWWFRGRDPKGTGIIVPQYEAPSGLKPIEVGTIIDFKTDNRDITATIVNLAIHGYLKIIESQQQRALQKDKVNYSLQLTNADFSQLDASETLLMAALFSGQPVGAVVDVSDLKNKLYTTAKALSKTVEKNLTDAGYFRSNPLNSGVVLKIVVGCLVFATFYLWKVIGLPFSAGCLLAAIIAVFFASSFAARTQKGVAAKEQILGLKLYLQVAEKDRLEKLQGPDAQYAANAGEPVKTADLFEKLLPYAMVLGVEKQWAGQFAGLYTSPPSWYSGNWAAFNSYYLVTSLSDGIGSAVNTAFSAPRSSGSSGFGGGFAGGGGGGGGGGGW